MTAKKILLVDGKEPLRGVLARQLDLHDEFATSQAATGAEALEITKSHHFDLILLNLDLDGGEVCKMLRKSGVKCPVIMLTAADGDADTILRSEFGTNDCVIKPFKFAVLLACIRSHLRQHELSDDAVFSIGPYIFRPSAKLLLQGESNEKVRLTEKETSILKFLFGNGGKAVSRDVLLNEVWGYNAGVTTHTLETHIYRLRQKIESDPSSAEILVTEPGGYRLLM
mgnify:FL=1